MLKELANEIAPALTELFNKSLEEGVVPLDWRVAAVSPIFKKGKKCMAENYRPVSLTSNVCKVLEGLVREAMIEYLTARNLLSPKQFGFLGKRSTMLQLLTYLDYCSEAIGKGLSVDAIYLDFQKAFDTVSHRRLLTKLEGYGIDSKLSSGYKASSVIAHNMSQSMEVSQGKNQLYQGFLKEAFSDLSYLFCT